MLKNVGENEGWETIVLGILFTIVGSLHIPIIFFVGKDALLIIIFTFFYTKDETNYKDIHAQDVSDLTVSANFGAFHKSKLLEKNENLLENGFTKSHINDFKSKTILKKTAVVPNIDVSITRQFLAYNATTSMFHQGGVEAYDKELSEQAVSVKEPSHRDLPLWIYLPATLSVYAVEIAISCFVDDIGIVFEFIGALAISMVFFIQPGAFYLKSVYLSGEKGSIRKKNSSLALYNSRI